MRGGPPLSNCKHYGRASPLIQAPQREETLQAVRLMLPLFRSRFKPVEMLLYAGKLKTQEHEPRATIVLPLHPEGSNPHTIGGMHVNEIH
jgi:hypothetical protein